MQQYNILLIDDDDLFVFLTCQSFNNSPLVKSIDSVKNETESKTYLDEKAKIPEDFPDIILIDLHLGDENGLTIASYFQQHLSCRFPHTRLFLLTSSKDKYSINKALAIPVIEDVLQKPLTPHTLKEYLIT